jgi:hypothetical protein
MDEANGFAERNDDGGGEEGISFQERGMKRRS